jgi:dihydropteroate synthase
MIWRARNYEFVFPRPALLMGIVNVTPDSFSDGGQFFAPEAAVEHALQLIAEGADILDIGGESTRPGSPGVSETEELRRVMPVLEKLAGQAQAPLSIDTRKPAVARAALQAGASIVNDIGANRDDPALWQLVAEYRAGYVAMHMQGSPQTMQESPTYRDVVGEVGAFFAERLEQLRAAQVVPEQVVLDVGIGFGKTINHNLQLIAALSEFTKYKRPLLLGVSRKSFIGRITDAPEMPARLPGSMACACWAVAAGVQIIRAHDVAATRQAVRMIEAIQAHAASHRNIT